MSDKNVLSLNVVPQNIEREEEQRSRPSDQDAEEAVRLLLTWIGENPEREGLIETPARYVRAWKEFFSGYQEDPRLHLRKTFEEVEGYQGPITMQNIRLETTCEHHLVPFVGEAFISYLPGKRVVGISKLVRMMEGYAKRMQIQEKLTAQIATAIQEELKPRGVAVAIRSNHFCVSTRGAHNPSARMLTTSLHGAYEMDDQLRRDFMDVVTGRAS